MARTVKPVVKFLLILLIIGAIVAAWKFLVPDNLAKKIMPESKKSEVTTVTSEAKAAMKAGTPVLNVVINTWGGYAPGIYYNKGLAASLKSRYYTEEGILVNFTVTDDFKGSRDMWKSGSVDVMGFATVDSIPTEIADLMNMKPKAFIKADDSRGGDVVIAVAGIKSAKDLVGKKVAYATGTPSHSLILTWLTAGGVDPKSVEMVGTDSETAAVQAFKTGAVHAAVVFSPNDQDCIQKVDGAHVVFSTKQATNVIADIFLANSDFLESHPDLVKKFMRGWFKGVAEITTDAGAKSEAISLLEKSFNIDNAFAALMFNNVRFSTYGDNLQFFGLKSGGVKGEEMYDKMSRMFNAAGLAPNTVPMWRTISDSSLVASLNLSGNGYEAEGAQKFAAPTAADVNAPAIADKSATVQFAFGSAKLSEDGKMAINMAMGNTSREFGNTRIRIEGNTDSVGSHDSNMKLSNARARSVANYLVQKYHFDPNRFVIVGHGPDNPVSGCETNATDECRARNRRTEFHLLK